MKKHLLFLTIILFANSLAINAQSTSGILNKNYQATNRKTKHWFEQRKWANGLTLTPHARTNINLFHEQYLSNQEAWDSAFSFLKNQPLFELAAGKYPILGDRVFATISEGGVVGCLGKTMPEAMPPLWHRDRSMSLYINRHSQTTKNS